MPRFLIGITLCAVLLGATTGALQDKRSAKQAAKEPPTLDPYTEEDATAMEAAGYERFGNFNFAAAHTTEDIDTTLAGPWMRWVETKHFRIGSSLPEYTPTRGDRSEKTKLKAELKRLHERIPNVPTKLKKLDPWLRLHLFAQRAEELYAELESLLGVDEHSFPTRPGLKVDGKYMGEGPHLGMRSKFNLLLFEKMSSVGRYKQQFAGLEGDNLFSHLFHTDGTLLFAISQEHPSMDSDTTLHCTVTYVLTMNMLNGFKNYRHFVPAWMSSGLGHWFARRVDPSRNYFTQERLFDEQDENIWNWGPKVRARVGHEYYPSFEELLAWPDPYSMKYNQHMLAWSRVDYLVNERRDGLALWLDLVKTPFGNRVPTHAELKARQLEAMQEAWELDPTSFDEAWSTWAAKHYPRK